MIAARAPAGSGGSDCECGQGPSSVRSLLAGREGAQRLLQVAGCHFGGTIHLRVCEYGHRRMVRLLALILPLGLDTFAVAAALGMIGLSGTQRLRLGLLFAAFEGGMPLIGLAVGAALGTLLGRVADYVAVAALIGIGVHMLLANDEKKEETTARRLASTGGVAMIGLGISISLDELAIGFALGLAHVPVVAAIILIAAQAFIVAQVGFAIGRRVGERFREGAERLAGVVLIGLGLVLLLSQFVPLPI